MPRKQDRVRLERGLYRAGNVYFACATPMGSRKVVWKKLGAVGVMEARRLRDEFVAETRRAPAAPRSRRVTYGEVTDEWLSDQEARLAVGDLARSTLAGYRDELKRHILPVFGERQIASITPDDLVRWHRDTQRKGLSTWSIKHAWAPLWLVLRYAVRHYGLPGNPADALLPQERPKPARTARGSSTRRRSGYCSTPPWTRTACRSPRRSSPACGSASCLGSRGRTSTSRPASSRSASRRRGRASERG